MPEAPRWMLQPIRRDHLRDSFDCGNVDLNDFLRRYARQNEDFAIARTTVACRDRDLVVKGYYTLRTGQVELESVPPEQVKRFPKYPIPVVHLARLAVDRGAQGSGLGETLLIDALEKALTVSKAAGAYAVEVIAVDGPAKRFYLKYGFRELIDDGLHLYLPMRAVEALFERKG